MVQFGFSGEKTTLQEMTLNLAAYDFHTKTLGPGVRAAIWVNGCVFSCVGCIAPEWIPLRQANLVQIDWIVRKILDSKEVDGLTLSGGEPMLQAAGLLELVRLVRRVREINVICFSGYTLDELTYTPPSADVPDFLAEIDLLVDGRYQAELNEDHGLRGSSNQKFHYLTNRLKHIDFEKYPRKVEITVASGYVLIKGIPTKLGLKTINQALQLRH